MEALTTAVDSPGLTARQVAYYLNANHPRADGSKYTAKDVNPRMYKMTGKLVSRKLDAAAPVWSLRPAASQDHPAPVVAPAVIDTAAAAPIIGKIDAVPQKQQTLPLLVLVDLTDEGANVLGTWEDIKKSAHPTQLICSFGAAGDIPDTFGYIHQQCHTPPEIEEQMLSCLEIYWRQLLEDKQALTVTIVVVSSNTNLIARAMSEIWRRGHTAICARSLADMNTLHGVMHYLCRG